MNEVTTSINPCYFLVVSPAPANIPALDQRAQRLTALQATALALQSRLQSHALRLSGGKEGAVPQPAAKMSTQSKETETGFQGVLPGLNSHFVVYKQSMIKSRKS